MDKLTLSKLSSIEDDREIDKIVAEVVFGYEVSWWSLYPAQMKEKAANWRRATFNMEVLLPTNEGDMPILEMLTKNHWHPVPRFSTDILAAQQVMRRASFIKLEKLWDGTWYCWICFGEIAEGKNASAIAETECAAICYASILAMSEGKDE